MALFLVWYEEGRAIDPDVLLALDRFELRPGLVLIAARSNCRRFTIGSNERFPAARPSPLRRSPARRSSS